MRGDHLLSSILACTTITINTGLNHMLLSKSPRFYIYISYFRQPWKNDQVQNMYKSVSVPLKKSIFLVPPNISHRNTEIYLPPPTQHLANKSRWILLSIILKGRGAKRKKNIYKQQLQLAGRDKTYWITIKIGKPLC